MSRLFLGGVPTNADVRKLKDAFPDLTEGTEIRHEEVERVLELSRESSRYRCVTLAWRRDLLTHSGVDLGAVAGIGFRCLNPSERIAASVDGFKSGTRKQMRSVRRSALVQTDDPTLLKKQDVLRRFGAAIAQEAGAMMKEIEPPRAQPQAPRLVSTKKDAA